MNIIKSKQSRNKKYFLRNFYMVKIIKQKENIKIKKYLKIKSKGR